jgi:replicative DNA helicase
MDLELRFISTLLRSNRNEQTSFFNQSLPESIFAQRGKEIHWLYQYWQQNQRLPSATIFETRFRLELPHSADLLKTTAQAVLDAALYRGLRDIVERTKKMVDNGQEMTETVNFFRSAAAGLNLSAPAFDDIDFGQSNLVLNRYRNLVRLLSADDQSMLIDTPWATCNKLINFYQAGDLICIAARPHLGKTWILCQWLIHLLRKGARCLCVSKEMPSERVADRLEAIEYQFSFPAMKSGSLPPRELRRWREARKKPLPYSLIISGDETIKGIGLIDVAQKIEHSKPTVVMVDGAYLLTVDGMNRNATATETLRAMSSRFKAMAKAMKVVLVVVFQLNRPAEDKKGVSRGTLSNIYGTDALGQDSDGVFLLNGEIGAPVRTFSVAKGRDGGTGDFIINFKLDPPDFSEQNQMSTSSRVVFSKIT